MAFFFFQKRSIIPNWRDFRKTIALSELSDSMGAVDNRDFNTLKPYIIDWRDNISVSHAGELVSNAFAIGLKSNEDVKTAAQFILNSTNVSSALRNISKKILDKTTSKEIDLIDYSSFEDYNSSIKDHSIYNQIRFLKKILHNQPRNAVKWVELSRLYAIAGNNNKAEKAMLIALGLSHNNRYISRSATRLFCHMKESDKALYYLRKNSELIYDPWILASEIGTNRYNGKSSRHIKKAIQMINDKKHNPFDLCELTSAVATEEYINGKKKNSKLFFRKSLVSPNDNTIAQAEWVSGVDRTYALDIDYTSVLNPFEAQSTVAYVNSNWKESLEYAKSWFLDMPFSVGAAVFGSYVASLIDEFQAMEEFCRLAILSNPSDLTLLNNFAYSLAKRDKIADALSVIKRMNLVNMNTLDTSNYISISATLGLINFRQGNYDAGRKLYDKSIEKAKEKNYHHYAVLAQLHLINEELRIGNNSIGPLLDNCGKMVKKYESHDTNFLWNKVQNYLKPKQIKII